MVIFLTRKFPPSTGGMETFSYELTTRFSGEKQVIHYGQAQWHVVWAAPLLLLRGVVAARRAKRMGTPVVLHLGDLVLAPIAPFLRMLTGIPIVVTVHGLELTFSGFGGLYPRLITWGMRAISHYVAVSQPTADLLTERGVGANHITVIPHGVDLPEPQGRAEARATLCLLAGVETTTCEDRLILLSVGRLVERKGVAWCIEHLLPRILDLNPLYIITSTGPERERIAELIVQHDLQQYVHTVGRVSDDTLHAAYTGCDIFLMPNIHIPGDTEGFGFVAIEAAIHGAPVLTSGIEGIAAAIHDGKNGVYAEAENPEAFEAQIRAWAANPSARKTAGTKGKTYTAKHFQWDDIIQQYTDLFSSI